MKSFYRLINSFDKGITKVLCLLLFGAMIILPLVSITALAKNNNQVGTFEDSGLFFGGDFSAGGSIYDDGHYFDELDKNYEQAAFDNFKYIIHNNSSADLTNALNFSENSEAISAAIKMIFWNLEIIGLALVVVYCLLEVVEKMTRDMLDAEGIIRIMIKFVIVKTVMDNGPDLMMAIFDLGKAVTQNVSNLNNKGEDAYKFLQKIANYLQDSNMLMCFVVLLLGFVLWLLCQILNVIILATAYGRIITIIVRGGFAPIGCASMVQDGFAGPGMRYLKKFFAAVLQGGIIYVIMFAGQKLMQFTMANVVKNTNTFTLSTLLGGCILCIVILFTEVMLVLKSNTLADDIVGA